VFKPQTVQIAREELPRLKYAANPIDRVELSTRPKSVTIDYVKSMFPTGKMSENNFLINSIKDLIGRLETNRKIIDLTPELSNKDYKFMTEIMNLHNGKYIERWQGYSDTDILANKEKLALFVRTLRLTKQGETFLQFNPAEWDVVVDGVIKKPKQFIMPVLEYKAKSSAINGALSDSCLITQEIREEINAITEYLNLFEVKKDFTVYRGDKTFDILQVAEINGQKMNLAEIIEQFTNVFQKHYLENKYNQRFVDEFTNRYLMKAEIFQKRFMSTAMDKKGTKEYAKKIFWTIRVPQGTKGASIESFNIERKMEAEFLGQRNGKFVINNAVYKPEKDIWLFEASIEQLPLTKI